MTTDTMRRVRQKQRADRMSPAYRFQDQRLSRFLPAPKPRSRTSDELRDVRTVKVSLGAMPPTSGLADATSPECPYHVDQKCSADCWYRNPVRGAWLDDD